MIGSWDIVGVVVHFLCGIPEGREPTKVELGPSELSLLGDEGAIFRVEIVVVNVVKWGG